MKCENCSAPVTLEDEFCPFCGALNKPAREHIEAMRHYRLDYEDTKREVLEYTKKQSAAHTKLLILGGLILLNVIVLALLFNSYEIAERFQERRINAHADNYRVLLEKLETSGDYQELRAQYNARSLCYSDKLDDFSTVSGMASDYERICEYLFYLKNTDVYYYYSDGEKLQHLAEAVCDFYEQLSYKDSSYRPARYEKGHLEAMYDMEGKIKVMLAAGCKLSDEDLEKLPELESQELMIMMGRRMGLYE